MNDIERLRLIIYNFQSVETFKFTEKDLCTLKRALDYMNTNKVEIFSDTCYCEDEIGE